MGAKGTQTTQTAQQQSYAPTGAGYIQNALNQGQAAASLPFNIPQAPVAGFSPQQQQAFGLTGQYAQAAQPYFGQAANYYNAAATPNVSQFFNPYASAVTSQMQNIFGEQNAQNTGSLTQAAGGVGADRIAVGQADLANQQGLAAGQTLANLYAPALGAAQSEQGIQQGIGNSFANLGQSVQGAGLQGAQSLLGTGGLQQQLQQAQLNAPYQQQLAQAAFPYQQAQFNAGITGALAPALGGTTQGTGTSQTQYNPSLFSQILGGAGALGSIGGYLGSAGGKGAVSGVPQSVDALGEAALVGLARGGAVGGNPYGYASGGTPVYSLGLDPFGSPTDVSKLGIIPEGGLPTAQTHMPSLNLNAQAPSMQGQQQQSGANLGNLGQTLGNIGKLFSARGGAVNPYDTGASKEDKYAWLHHKALDKLASAYDDGGNVDPDHIESRFDATKQAIASGAFDPSGINETTFQGTPGMVASNTGVVPLPASRPGGSMADAGDDAADDSAASPPPSSAASVPPNATPTSGAAPSSPIAAGNPYAATSTDDSGPSLGGFLKSPYAALLQASLGAWTPQGIAGGLKSGIEGFQKQETVDQASQKLQQEAQEHLDEQTKITAYQQAQIALKKQELDKSDEGVIDDQTAKFYAQIFNKTGSMPSLGYGKIAAANRTKIAQFAMQDAQGQGQTPADIVANRVDYAANRAGATTAARSGANIDRAVIEAQNTFPLAEQASAAVPRGDWVPINQLSQAAKKAGSNSALGAFEVANQGVITAYAAAMGRGSPVTTVHAQQHAEELLSTATSHEAYVARLRQMQKEMDAAQAAPGQVRANIRGQITGQQPPAPANSNVPAPDRAAIEAEMRKRGLLQ
jgi:hypothetical protein